MSKNRKWKIALLATLVVALLTGLCACGGGSGGGEDKAPAKESKDGFDKATKQEVTVNGVTYSLPDYFVYSKDNSTNDKQYYYAETGEAPVVLMISDADLDENTDFDKDYRESFVASLTKEATDSADKETDLDMTINGMPAISVSYNGKADEKEMEIKCYLFFNEEQHKLSGLLLGQSVDSQYDYMNDFDKIAQSAKAEKKPEVSKDFKKTMDGYEKFFNKYVKFMKKYQESGDALGMLSDYTDYMNEYQKVMNDLESIDQDELSEADLAYYIEVNARIQKKLLEVSGN